MTNPSLDYVNWRVVLNQKRNAAMTETVLATLTYS
jgi:hypothetical protein